MIEHLIEQESDDFDPHPVVPIRPGIELKQPATRETIEAVIGVVKELTPPLKDGERNPFVFKREIEIVKREVGRFILRQFGLIDKNNPVANTFNENNQYKDIVNVEVHPFGESPVETFVVSHNDETGYDLKRSALTVAGDSATQGIAHEVEREDYEEIMTGVDEDTAVALLETLKSLQSK